MFLYLSNIFEKIFFWRQRKSVPNIIEEVDQFKIEKLSLVPNPRYPTGKLWGYRPVFMIDKIIVHQELAEGDTLAVHNYHTNKASHLRQGGAPKIAYHYTIEKSGTVYSVNEHEDVVWHCKGQNIYSIGIMMCGDFDGYNHIGKSKPTEKQLVSLSKLLDVLTKELNLPKTSVCCHSDFGKPVCPGYIVENHIKKYKG